MPHQKKPKRKSFGKAKRYGQARADRLLRKAQMWDDMRRKVSNDPSDAREKDARI